MSEEYRFPDSLDNLDDLQRSFDALRVAGKVLASETKELQEENWKLKVENMKLKKRVDILTRMLKR